MDLAMTLYLFQMAIKKPFGEMKANLKDKISHRYRAFNKIKRYFKILDLWKILNL
jgi:inosine/xanthosine triphosphate pyrophosphatase family protein